MRSRLLCQEPPPPPADVEQLPTVDDAAETLREVLAQHVDDPACAGCHLLLDPVGSDLAGRFRTKDNGHPVDASGELLDVSVEETKFIGARALAARLM